MIDATKLRALKEKASPLPWCLGDPGTGALTNIHSLGPEHDIIVASTDTDSVVGQARSGISGRDADFIVEMMNASVEMLDENVRLEERVAFAERERDDALRARDNALQMRDEALVLKKAAGQSAARRIEQLVALARSLATHGLVVERKDIERRLDEILK